MKIVRAEELQFVPASHEDSKNPGVLKKVLAGKDDFAAGHVQMLNWSLCPVGSSFRRHYHEDMQEIFLIIDGSVAMTVDDEEVQLGSGDAILIDAGQVHQMTNTCDHDVNYIVFGISSGKHGKTIVVEE